MDFKVMGNEIKFSEEFIELNTLRNKFLELGTESVKKFIEKCSEKINDMEELSKEGETFALEFLDDYIAQAIRVIKDFGVDSIEEDTFKEKYYYGRYCSVISKLDEVIEEYLSNKDSNYDVDKLNEERKKRRENWYSEDEKINERIKANLEIGGLNKASDLIDDESIKIKDIESSSETEDAEKKKFNEVLEDLASLIKESIFNIHFSILDVLNDNDIKKVAQYNEVINAEKANELLEEISNKEISEDSEIDIKEIIELNPYNEEAYKLLLNKCGDKNNEVEVLAKFLGYHEIENYKEKLLDEYYKELPKENEEQIKDSKNKVAEFATNLSIKEYEKYIKELESNIKIETDDSEEVEKEETNLEEVKEEAEVKEKVKNEIEVKEEVVTGVEEEVSEDNKEKKLLNKVKELPKEKKIRLAIAGIVAIIFVIYVGVSIYFQNKFYFGTIVDGMDVSGKTVEETVEGISTNASDYKLEIQLRDNEKAEVKGTDIGLVYDFREEIENLKNNQNSFAWISGVFSTNEHSLSEGISYDEEKFNKVINSLPCFNSEKIVEPKDATLKYENNNYVIEKEVYGNKLNKEKTNESIINAIKSKENNINLEDLECYENPKYTSESKEVIDAKSTMDTYVKTKINYNVNGGHEVIDGNTISSWIELDSEYKPAINESKVKAYVDSIGNKYDRAGNIRQFGSIKVTTSKEIIAVDRNAEVTALLELIKEGKEVSRDAKISKSAVSGNLVNTFVEVDITRQQIWFYKNGQLITQGPVTTGNVSKGHGTRVGVFKLYGKQRNAVLKGEDYEVPVDFWMPFDGGIGLHDASWRGQFGGQLYKTNGSHGCVNMPRYIAEAIYNNIKVGDYVICHY